MKKIGLIAGSIQTESYAKKISQNLGMLLPSDFLPGQITSLIRTSPESFNGSLLMMYF